jgi:uncharacterized phage protein (TIGR01671 family)
MSITDRSRKFFRAWTGDKMIEFGIFDTDEGYHIREGISLDGLPIMQHIGLQDKNKKDIYEDDIGEVRTAMGRIERFVVKWGIHRRKMESGWTVDIPGFCFLMDNNPTFPITNNYLNGHDLDIIEIIGNIHEHPHLIPAT